MCLRFDERVLVRVWICEPALRNVLGCGHVYGMTHLTAVRMCVPSLSPFPQLDSYADLCFSVWEVNSRVPVLGLKITLGLKFLIPPPSPSPLLILSYWHSPNLSLCLFFFPPLPSVLEQAVQSASFFFFSPLNRLFRLSMLQTHTLERTQKIQKKKTWWLSRAYLDTGDNRAETLSDTRHTSMGER